jgi:WD40 repeat protein
MMQIPEGSFIKYLIVNHESGETIQLPLMNARFCGWSLDGSRVYQYKSTSNEYTSFSERERPTQYDGIVQIQTIKTTQYEPIFELFETNFLSGTLPQNLFKKSKNITIRYSASTNRFLLVMDNSAYLLENYSKAKPIKIIEKCSLAEWSNDGNLIAYQNSKDKKLYLYTVATEQTEGLTTVSDKILLKR